LITCNLCGASFDGVAHTRWRKDGNDIVECPFCTLLFRAEIPSRAELATIYGESYFSSAAGDTKGQGYLDYVGEERLHRLAARRRLERLERVIAPGRLLDVGAAAGFFVDEAGRHGWTACGIDISPTMVRWGRDERGADLSVCDLQDFESPRGSFDVVTMWDYLEHSRDPAADMAQARTLLRAGGALALSTGDAAALVARLSGVRWHLLTPRHHNFFFTSRTICDLLERHDFEIRWTGHPGNAYSIPYLAHKLRTLVDIPPVRAVSTLSERHFFSRLMIPLNLFDIVTVIAVKSTSGC
jgi:SAM-dependent methyltransferase